MAQVVPKLNLNKTPALVESNSLIFAKNIRLDVDSTIHRDYSIFPLSIAKGYKINNLINYNSIIYKIIADIEHDYESGNKSEVNIRIYNRLRWISGSNIVENDIIVAKDGKYNIVGIIPNSNEFYIFINGTYKHDTDTETDKIEEVSCIICYDERLNKFYPCNCNWNWSGGSINGCVINNLIGEKILNVGESNTSNLVPLKSINLNTSNINDDESIYTQIPNVPITNISYGGLFSYVIPNGVYQFFIRYKIRKDFYTNWFPASNDLFIGNKNSTITSFGSLSYVNTHRDSDNSFILNVEHLLTKEPNYAETYESYQIGFILSHDDASYARAWKHFTFDITTINFDYKATDAEEIEITDLLKPTYGLYNVGNIATFKNRLYISNYIESDFNDNTLQEHADEIEVDIKTQEGSEAYAGYPIVSGTVAHNKVIAGLVINNEDKSFTGYTGIIHEIFTKNIDERDTLEEAIINAINGGDYKDYAVPDLYAIRVYSKIQSLLSAQTAVRNIYKNTNLKFYDLDFGDNEIEYITINGKDCNKDEVLDYIYNADRFLTTKCKWIDAKGDTADTVKIVIARKVTVETTIISNGGLDSFKPYDPANKDFVVNRDTITNISRPDGNINSSGSSSTSIKRDVTYLQEIHIQFIAYENKYENNNPSELTEYTTLIPYQKYNFYIHFIKSTGEITNGYLCSKAKEVEAPYMPSCTSVIYPCFKNIKIPNGYDACFFSICHTKITSATVFEIEDDIRKNLKEGSCLDISMMLIPGSKNIHIKQENTTDTGETELIEIYTAEYYDSSDTSLPRYFGATGIIVDRKNVLKSGRLAYSITDYNTSETENTELIKCTPYLSSKNLFVNDDNVIYYDDYTRMNLLGYICNVTPLHRDRCIQYYSDGSSVYFKKNSDDNTTIINDISSLYLEELSKYSDGDVNKKLSTFGLKFSNNTFIYSNYNLNYVSLSEEPKMSIKTYYNRPANSSGQLTESQQNDSSSTVLRLLSSQLLSMIYTLPSMYKDYVRKTYSIYLDNEITEFNNTIRSSVLYGDENNINILTFDANDYYNIPTNRGIIVNLIAVGDAILVHTQDSMFKFSGSNIIQSSDGEIQTSESKPFDTGVSEIFGSDFGFAGIQNKSDHIVTENGYIFFDRDSRIVYMYSGQGQIIKVSDSIEKLFRSKNIDAISFANDYYNNRFFLSIMFYDEYIEDPDLNSDIKRTYYPVTLSFNISENIKAFVSLHDFYFHYAFNTKTKCYFLTSDNTDICYVNKNYLGHYTKLDLINDKLYPQLVDKDYLKLSTIDKPGNEPIIHSINSYDSIIDIIVNDAFETIKTLNAVNWCGNKIIKEFDEIKDTDVRTLRVAEDINDTVPCKAIRIYTDTCMTPLNECNRVSNDSPITSVDSYKYPRLNQGSWTFNYFRNILNSKGHISQNNYSGDNNSLIEGKYFVIRFVFDNDFKFETLSLNYNYKQ